jgi:hypothetical protein
VTSTSPEPGLVISYAYLWHSQSVQGVEEGYKERPCVIVSAEIQAQTSLRVLVLPMTHSTPAPANRDLTQEVPPTLCRHLRLDDGRCWIVLTEANEFQWPGPDLGHSAPGNALVYERLPPRFFEKVRHRFITAVKAGKAAAVRRTDV